MSGDNHPGVDIHAESDRRARDVGEALLRDWNTAKQWTKRIREQYRTTASANILLGHLLNEAKAALPHGEFLAIIESELPFSARTAQRLMAIAEHPIIGNATHVSHLPQSWGTLYELTKVESHLLTAALKNHTINPEMERRDVAALLLPKARKSAAVEPRAAGERAVGVKAKSETIRIVAPFSYRDGGPLLPPAAPGEDILEIPPLLDRRSAKASEVDELRGEIVRLQAHIFELEAARDTTHARDEWTFESALAAVLRITSRYASSADARALGAFPRVEFHPKDLASLAHCLSKFGEQQLKGSYSHIKGLKATTKTSGAAAADANPLQLELEDAIALAIGGGKVG